MKAITASLACMLCLNLMGQSSTEQLKCTVSNPSAHDKANAPIVLSLTAEQQAAHCRYLT